MPCISFSLCAVKSVSMVFSVFLAKICILYRSVLLKSYGGEGMGKQYVTESINLPNKQVAITQGGQFYAVRSKRSQCQGACLYL